MMSSIYIKVYMISETKKSYIYHTECENMQPIKQWIINEENINKFKSSSTYKYLFNKGLLQSDNDIKAYIERLNKLSSDCYTIY